MENRRTCRSRSRRRLKSFQPSNDIDPSVEPDQISFRTVATGRPSVTFYNIIITVFPANLGSIYASVIATDLEYATDIPVPLLAINHPVRAIGEVRLVHSETVSVTNEFQAHNLLIITGRHSLNAAE